jgi:hypothetical protein
VSDVGCPRQRRLVFYETTKRDVDSERPALMATDPSQVNATESLLTN